MARQLNKYNLMVNVDSPNVVKLITSSSSIDRLTRPLVTECRDILQAFHQVQLNHYYREANQAADLLAKMGSSQQEDFVYYVTPPFILLDVGSSQREDFVTPPFTPPNATMTDKILLRKSLPDQIIYLLH